MLDQIIHCIEVFSHASEYQERIHKLDMAKFVMIALNKANELNEMNTIINIISCLSFYTNQEREWMIICKPEFIKFCSISLNSTNEVIAFKIHIIFIVFKRKS